MLESPVTHLISCKTLGKSWRKFFLKTVLLSWWETEQAGCWNNRGTCGYCFFLWILVLQSFCLFCKGNGFWNVFTFSSTDVRSRQVPPKSQEATGLCSKGLLGSTGKITFFFFSTPTPESYLHLVLSMRCHYRLRLLPSEAGSKLLNNIYMCVYIYSANHPPLENPALLLGTIQGLSLW